MTEPPACCTPGTSAHDIAEIMAQHDCGAVPVVEEATGSTSSASRWSAAWP